MSNGSDQTKPHTLPVLPQNIPPELKAHPSWVLWRWVERDGKATKPPYQPNGQLAKVDDPSTWITYSKAITAYEGGGFDGIGIVLTANDDLIGIDLDKCRDPIAKSIEPGMAVLAGRLPTYCEVSPSGTGIRLIATGSLPQGGRRKGQVELYETGRYVTITGHRLNGGDSIRDCTQELATIHAEIFGAKAKVKKSPKDAPRSHSLYMDDDDLIIRIRRSKQGPNFDRLWSGVGEGEDHSAADLSLCLILAWWTNRNPDQIDRLFRQSGLMRPKWDERHAADGRTYGRMTIEKAIAGCTGSYRGEPATREEYVSTDTADTANNGFSESPEENHADTADTAEAKSPIPSLGDRPTFRVFDDLLEHGGTKYGPGVWHFGTDKDGNPTKIWVCSPLYIKAVTFDGQGNNFGRLLRFRPTVGSWREWAMPMELLRGSGEEMRGELLSMGVEIDPSMKARNLLATYLQDKPPDTRVRCALQVGWCGDSFVLPDTVIGPSASDVIFQSGERGHDEYTKGGTLSGWQAGIAALAIGNSLLLLALSAAFTGPLLVRSNAEGGGLHFVGDSSSGKTTAIEAACSVWGGPNYRRSWRTTANGLEGAALLFNDGLLALDELSECDPHDVGAIVYSLGNGYGKQRASRTGSARTVTRWRCFVLSSGENTISTAMAEAGRLAKAGQSIRLLDISAKRKHGAWDTLHGFSSGAAFSDAIKRATSTHHGHAGREFLEQLTRDKRDFCALLEQIKTLPLFLAVGGEGQEKRTAGRFALIALAGELATEYGLTEWPKGAATEAAASVFKTWGVNRGKGNSEHREILDQVVAFLDRHGDSRFSSAKAIGECSIRDRAGWWRASEDGTTREYLFTRDALREAVHGFDLSRALDALQEAGAIDPPNSRGERRQTIRIGGRPMHLYPIKAEKLGSENGA